MAIDQKSGSRPRNPANVMRFFRPEQKGFVGHTGFQTMNILNLRFRNLKNFSNQFHRFIIRTCLIFGIKHPKFFQIFKFVYLLIRLPVNINFQIFYRVF